MKEIKYLKGDATTPISEGPNFIVHICNDIGGWGKGFVLAISSRWKEPELEYRKWFQSKEDFELGKIQLVNVDVNTIVVHMIAQKGIYIKDEVIPLKYEALDICLIEIRKFSLLHKAKIHMPRIGCGLAGGKWELVEPLIIKNLSDYDIEFYVYDF